MSFRSVVTMLAGVVPASMAAIFLFLAVYAWPAIQFNGAGFLFHLQ